MSHPPARPFPADTRSQTGGVALRWTLAPTDLGEVFVAATAQGVCRVVFTQAGAHPGGQTPAADQVRDDAGLSDAASAVARAVERPGEAHGLSLDVTGTEFQRLVWRELARVPPGRMVTYATLAERVGRPGAARAVGGACGANPLAVLIPCHRAVRADGSAGGYVWGLDRKRELLARELGQTKL